MRRGDFIGTIVPIHTCVRSGCVVWNRYVGQVRRMNVCNRAIHIKNNWDDFLDPRARHIWGPWCGCEARMVQQEQAATFSDIFGDGRYVRAYCTARADVGKTIRLFGEDNNGQPLREKDAEGNWIEGVTITFAAPFASTSIFIRRIDRVIKDVTQGDIRLYAYHATLDVLEDLALYSPTETTPSYEKYRLRANVWLTSTTSGQGSCCPTMSVVALTKLKHIDAVVDSDLIVVDNIEAIKLMVQSIKYGEQGDRASQQGFELDSIREGNLQIGDEQPLDQVPVTNDAFSGSGAGWGVGMF